MKKISAILFFFVSLSFASASMAQSSNPWVGEWQLTFTNPDTGEFLNTSILTIDLENNNLVGTIVWTMSDGTKNEYVIEHFNDSDTELIIGIKTDKLYFPLTLRIEDSETLSGTWQEFNAENTFSNVIAERSVAQSNNPWAGQWNLDFKNKDDEETNFVATLNIEYVNGKLEGYIIYFYQDNTREEVVIEHFNDSETDLILGFKVEGSDALFFPLRLSIEYDGSIYGSWEDEEESFKIVGFRIAAQTQISE
jgi:hypothetical protein